MLEWMRKRLLLIAGMLVLAVGLYAAVGFWLVPRLARSQAVAYVDRELGKSLSIGEIRFNPFTFRTEVHDIAVGDKGATGQRRPLVSLKRLLVDFQVSSLWKGAWTFRQIGLTAPYANAIIRSDGSLNLVELLPKTEPDNEPIPSVVIDHLAVTGGAIDFADLSRKLEPSKRLAPISFELDNFKTTGAGSGFVLSAVGDEGERFNWSGALSLQPLASQGKFTVGGLQATTAYKFLSEELPMQLTSGRLAVAGQYRFAMEQGRGMQLEATLSKAGATDLGLRDKNAKVDWVRLKSAELANSRFSYGKRRIDIDALVINGLDGTAWMEKDGSINLLRWAGGDAPAAASATPAGPDWAFHLGKLVLEQASLDFEDRTVTPAGKFKLSPMSLSVQALSLDMGKPLPITLQTTVNGKAKLGLQGQIIPDPFRAELAVDLVGMPLADVMSYLPSFPRVRITNGTVAGKGQLVLKPAADPGPAMSFEGSGSLNGFKVVEAGNPRELLSWKSVDAQGIRFTQAPDAISIQRVQARQPFATVSVAPDGSINLLSLFEEPEQGSFAQVVEDAPESGMPIKLARLDLVDATMAFSDYSIDPNFSARIQSLDGSVRGLSTATDSIADIDLQGYVINRYSPVTIKGGTNLFAFDKHTDVAMTFRNIDLPIFNPYSGRFAGYAISKGKLTTELHYQIDNRKLEAAHHVVLDQLEWGEATDSKDKVSLPIRLATSLLKDRHGVIDLNLPVTGSLDDPKFRVWPVVWQVLKNIMVKIVTAPFAFLGSLFEGAEDAQFVDFAPGSASLPEATPAHLAALAKGLADRPALRIEIPAGVAEPDAAAIAQARLHTALAGASKADSPAFESMEPKDQVKPLERLYKEVLGHKPELPEAPAAAEVLDRQQRKLEREQANRDWLQAQLLSHYQPTAAEVEALGRERANAIQDALLSSGELDPVRVFITAGKPPSVQEGKVRVELALE